MQTNLEYYKIFYYVSKYNSISLAAEALSISQPAVSQAVKHLESDLSCLSLCADIQRRALDKRRRTACRICEKRI